MTVDVDFIRGADVHAEGLTRAQAPLMRAMADLGIRVRDVRFTRASSAALFAYMYGPLAARLMRDEAGIVHFASSWYAHLVPLARKPTVVTCHDLIQVPGSPEYRSSLRAHRRFHTRAAFAGLARSDRVVCDSQAVADEFVRAVPAAAPRTHVIHLGVDPLFAPGPPDMSVLNQLGVRPPYVLYVGSDQERKNLPTLIAAIARARRTVPNLGFVKVGKPQTAIGAARFQAALHEHDLLTSTRRLESIDDSSLVQLYRGACATALVSLQEGFGFPAVEAMASGCPVVVSSVPPLPEIAGDAALIVDPHNTCEIASALVTCAADATARAELAARGVRRAADFTWDRAAEQYVSLYRDLVTA